MQKFRAVIKGTVGSDPLNTPLLPKYLAEAARLMKLAGHEIEETHIDYTGEKSDANDAK